MTLRRVLVFTILANIGFAMQANAEAPCPEVLQIRNAATEAWKKAMRSPTSVRCAALVDASSATQATLDYATINRALCGISAVWLSDAEQYDRQAKQARDNACAGRPLRPFPTDIIQR